ncbi:hypothetical protein CsatB_021803 [Cannabis sativa]|uniref:Uncharacterized protein n=1 Tax=Cannabis sativa TaxID=3483 RepID=A0A803QMR7_CANSA|nr:cold shock domain-containing protein 4 [Cannabis sativa]
MGSERLNGTVKWFNDQKGYGFITPSDGTEDLFVHQSAIRSDGFRSLADGETVEFQIETENNRTKAVDVTGPNEGPVQGTRGGSGGGGGRGGSRGGYGGGGRGGRGGGDGGCFKCGESGHMARDCFQGGSSGGGGGRYGGGGGGSGGGGGGNCFNCGGTGHFARECPNNPR